MDEKEKFFSEAPYSDMDQENSDIRQDPRFKEAFAVADQLAQDAKERAEAEGEDGAQAYDLAFNTHFYPEFVKRITGQKE